MVGKKRFVINDDVIIGYAQCSRKGFLLAFDLDQGVPHGYEKIITEQRLENIQNYFNSPKVNNIPLKLFTSKSFYKGEKYLKDALLKHQDLEAHSDLLTNILDEAGLKINYEPTVVSGLFKTNDDDKIKLAYAGHVLGFMQDKAPKIGSHYS